jgi:peptidoglycan/xylan/chitin deacetylase (PgdA/CDA1 family)
MQWEVWDQVEKILAEAAVKPICAVVPDNKDPKLQVAQPDPKFWDRVRCWQSQGWTIGLHGYEHRYVTQNSGIIGFNKFSEFAGLPLEEQEKKLRMGMEIFQREGVSPHLWIAPGHSFDRITVGLLKKLGLRVISDGFFWYPYVDPEGLLWIPQQISDFVPKRFGVWTISFHCNQWNVERIAKFRRDIHSYRDAIITCGEVISMYKDRRRKWMEALGARWMTASVHLRRTVWWRAVRARIRAS